MSFKATGRKWVSQRKHLCTFLTNKPECTSSVIHCTLFLYVSVEQNISVVERVYDLYRLQSRCLVLDDRMSSMQCIISRILSGYWNPVTDIRLTVHGFFFFFCKSEVQIYGNVSNMSLLSSIYHIITFNPENVLMLIDGGRWVCEFMSVTPILFCFQE